MGATVLSPYPLFSDTDGQPLEAGHIYVGAAGLDAETNAISTYWDSDATITAGQPIRTVGGYPTRVGAAAQVYVSASDFSMTVRDKNGNLVFTSLNFDLLLPSTSVSYDLGYTGSVARTVNDRFSERISVYDFGAEGDGATDDATALQAAFTWLGLNGGEMWFPKGGVFKSTTALTLTLSSDSSLKGNGTILADYSNTTCITVTTAGNDFEVDGLTFDGNDKCPLPMLVDQATQSTNKLTLNKCTFKDTYRTDAGDVYSVSVIGGFAIVNITGCRFLNASKALSVVGSVYGCSVALSSTYYAENIVVDGCYFDTITNKETSASAANTDCHGLRMDAQTVGAIGVTYTLQTAAVSNCKFVDCKRSAIYALNDRTTVTNCHVDRSIPGTTADFYEIQLDSTAGQISQCTFSYNDSAVAEDTLERDGSCIAFATVNNRGRPLSLNVSNCQVFSSVTETNETIQYFLRAANDDTSPYACMVSVDNVQVHAHVAGFMSHHSVVTGSGYSATNINNVYVDEIDYGLVFVADGGNYTQNQVYVSNISTPDISGSFVVAYRNTSIDLAYVMCRFNNSPHTGTPAQLSLSDGRKSGFLTSGVTSMDTTDKAGHAWVDSKVIGNDETSLFVTPSGCTVILSVNSTTTACCIFGLSSSGGAATISEIAGNEVVFGGTVNPNANGYFNIWATGGFLYIKNRTAYERVFTVFIVGSG